MFDVLALRQDDGVPRIGCGVSVLVEGCCCRCCYAAIREGAVDPVSCQTIDADQPLLTMQTIGAPALDLLPAGSGTVVL